MGRARPRARARFAAPALAVALTLGAISYGTSLASEGEPEASGKATSALSADPALAVSWTDGSAPAPRFGVIPGEITVPGRLGDVVGIRLTNGRFSEVPDACTPSTITEMLSYITAEGDGLFCALGSSPGDRTVRFPVRVVGGAGSEVSVIAATRSGAFGESPARAIASNETEFDPDLRLVSSPDFLNADVGDLRFGPNSWTPRRSENSINGRYQRALDQILDEWKGLDPAAVLVAGDLADGRWGADDQETGNFGPVDTRAQRVRALEQAARTYYPQWHQRFISRGLIALPAMGDHEYGDNNWSRKKRALAPAFKREYARQFTLNAAGQPIFRDRPRGPHELSAYAVRPSPDVQLITLDVFDITPQRARIQVDPQQMQWLERVLNAARNDGVTWIVVQGHTPILGPVPTRASSGLLYPGGADSELWRLFKEYDVDLYLNGEAHDLSIRQRDGITQITHGGLFQYGLTNFLVLDFLDDALLVDARDFSVGVSDSADGTRLWETKRTGMPKNLKVRGSSSYTVGTALLTDGRGLTSRSGALAADR